MKVDEIHIGDVLRIRNWDDMMSEDVGEVPGRISRPRCCIAFIDKMRYLCDQIVHVASFQNHYGVTCINTVEGIEKTGLNHWKLAAWMLEPVISYEPFVESEFDAVSFLMEG